MKIDKSIVVRSALLHQTIVVPGAINSERSLNQSRLPGVQMYCTPQGLIVMMKGQLALVPAANVCVMVLENSDDEEEKVKK